MSSRGIVETSQTASIAREPQLAVVVVKYYEADLYHVHITFVALCLTQNLYA